MFVLPDGRVREEILAYTAQQLSTFFLAFTADLADLAPCDLPLYADQGRFAGDHYQLSLLTPSGQQFCAASPKKLCSTVGLLQAGQYGRQLLLYTMLQGAKTRRPRPRPTICHYHGPSRLRAASLSRVAKIFISRPGWAA